MRSEYRTVSQHQRTSARQSFSMPDLQPDPVFDRLTRLALRVANCSIGLIGFLGERQLGIKSALGSAQFNIPGSTVPVTDPLVQHVVDVGEPVSIEDGTESALARHSDLIRHDQPQAVLTVPIALEDDVPIGLLFVGDTRARNWSGSDIAALEDLATLASEEALRLQSGNSNDPDTALLDQRRREKERLLESIGEGVYAVDTTGECHFINRAGANMLGYEPAEVIGKQMHQLVHYQYPDGRPMPREDCTIVQATLSGDAMSVSEHVFWRKDGTPIRVELTTSPVMEVGEVTGTVVRFSDLSEREIQMERLRQSEVLKTAMFEAALDCIITIDHDGHIVEFNSAAERTFGYSREYAVGRLMADLIMPIEHRDQCLAAFRDHLNTGESQVLGGRIERPALRSDGEMILTEMAVTRIDLPDQPYPLFTAYIRDITDRKQAEQDVRLYKHIVDGIGESVVASDMNHRIFYLNQAAEQALGWTIDELHGRDIRELIPAPDYREKSIQIGKQVREKAAPVSGEFRLLRKSGEEFPAIVTLAPLFDDGEQIAGAIGIYTEISGLKEAENEIRLYKHMTDAVGQALVANDFDRRITYWNRAAEEMFGWTQEEVLGRDFYEIGPADEVQDQMPTIGAHVREGNAWSGEFLLNRKDGTTFPVLMNVSPVLNEDGEIVQIIGAYTDISELKETEEEIRLYKHLADATGQALVADDFDRRITYFNRAAEAMFGWTADEVLGHDFAEIAVHEDVLHEVPSVSQHVRQGATWSGEFVLKHRNGDPIPVLMSVSPVFDDDGQITQVIGAYTDITELRRREDDVRFFQHVVEALGEAVVATSYDGRITYLNSAAESMLGWSEDEIIGRTLLDTIPDQSRLDEARGIAAQVRRGHAWITEFTLQRKDGSVFPALISVAPVFDENGETGGVISAYTDISERKRTENELRFHKHIVDAVGQAVVVSDTVGHITYWNKAAEDIYGWTADEAAGQLVFRLLPAHSDSERASGVTEHVAAGNHWAGESLVRRKDGTEFPAYFTVSPIRNTQGDIVGIIGVSHDISERKEHERQIEFHRVMLDAVGQTIVATDTNRVITYWSEGAEQALGWTAEEVLGRPIADVAPAAHLKDEAGELHRTVREGNIWTGEFPIRRKDGSTFPAVVSLAPINLAQQGIVGVIGVYTDVSELKETEAELRFHKHMLDAVGQAVLATDDNLIVTYWNRAAEELYGYSPDESIGMYLLDFLPLGSAGRQQAERAIEIVFSENGWQGEIVTYHKDGTEIAALVSASPILGEDDRHVGLIVALADITTRRMIENALHDSNEQITEILETMGDGFISLSSDWTIEYVNQQAELITGKDRDDLLGDSFWDHFPDPDHMPFFSRFQEAFRTGEPVSVTDYDPFLEMWLEVHASPSRDQLSVFFRDITERRNREVALREAEQRYRTLVEQLPAMTYIAQPDNVEKITYASPQVQSMLGYSADEWIRDPDFWTNLLHPDDLDFVREHDAMVMAEGHDHFVLEYRVRDIDGVYHWVRDSATLIRDLDGNPLYWQGLSHDITEQKRSERTIRESEQRFRSLFDNHPDAVFSIDRTGFVLSANPAFEKMTGFAFESGEPILFVDLVVPEDQQRVRDRFDETHRGDPQDFRAGVMHPEGRRIELNLTTIPIIVDDDIVGVHVVAQDVTAHQQLENQLAHQAYHDSLTGLPNRNLFQNRLTERLQQARVHDNRFAVLFFDLDDFKVINDSLGHSAGDQFLIEVAKRVQTCIRSGDLLARLGGDEFTLLLGNVTDDQDAVVIAERIASVLDDPFDIDGQEVFSTTSIGIAIGDSTSASADDILRNADLAMYEAKNTGKNRYAIFEPSMNSRAWLRLTLETEIRRGIPRNEFEVYYQPIINLNTGELDGVEALVRWDHPERGFLTPRDFISVAEQSGLIIPLGRWIIREASAQLREWQSIMPDKRPLRLSLNLSPRQYQHPRLIEELTRTLQSVELDANLITLEITENIAMDDSVDTLETLQQLKDVGVQLALDDFGTGFSALSYLRRFPIDIIKIDQSFVSGLGSDAEDTSIVQAVMAASLAMNLRVTAEGIETVDQLDMLRDLGCHYGQGYLFSRALSAEDMRKLIASGPDTWKSMFAQHARLDGSSN